MGSTNLLLGLKVLVLGLGSVFVVLVLLIIFISVMGSLVQNSEKKAIVPKVTKNTVKEEKALLQADDEDEIVAVITAAIACMAQREGKKFKISSFKRV